MQSAEAIISAWKPASKTSNLDAAKALTATLEKAGHKARTLEMLHKISGQALVFVTVEPVPLVVLVSVGDVDELRTHTKSLFVSPQSMPHRYVLARSGELPGDVSVMFSKNPVGPLEHELAQKSVITPALRLSASEVRDCVEELRPYFQKHCGVDLDPAKGIETLRKIDDIVLSIRPDGFGEDDALEDEDSVVPSMVLVGLGLIASHTVRTVVGGGKYGSMEKSEPKTLADADFFPSLTMGNMVANVARKVQKRWENGAEDSVAQLGAGIVSELKNNPDVTLGSDAKDDEPSSKASSSASPSTASSSSSGDLKEPIEMVGLAPFSAFLAVAGADGELEEKELKAFLSKLGSLKNPLLQIGLMTGAEPMERIKMLVEDKDLGGKCLRAAGAFFRENGEQGAGARAELLALAKEVAQTNGKRSFFGLGARSVRPTEQMALFVIEQLIDGKA